MPTDEFSIVYEVEPATRADLMQVRHQIGVMSRIASSFLIPDNHIGRATVRLAIRLGFREVERLVAYDAEQWFGVRNAEPAAARDYIAATPPRKPHT